MRSIAVRLLILCAGIVLLFGLPALRDALEATQSFVRGIAAPPETVKIAPRHGEPPMVEGWLRQARSEGIISDSFCVFVLTNRSTKSLRYTDAVGEPMITYFRKYEGEWRWAGPGYCGNGLQSAAIDPGDSLMIRIPAPHFAEFWRLGVRVHDPEQDWEIYAVTEPLRAIHRAHPSN